MKFRHTLANGSFEFYFTLDVTCLWNQSYDRQFFDPCVPLGCLDPPTSIGFNLRTKPTNVKIFLFGEKGYYFCPVGSYFKHDKFLAEVTLVGQPFVKDPDQKVGKLLASAGAAVNNFVRYEVGEGIEKKVEDFAAEVASKLNA